MARPKKTTKAGKIANEKWRKTMTERYGSITEKMAQTGRIGGRNGKGPDYKGGFAADHERARIAGALGGFKSRRTSKHINKLNKNKDLIVKRILGKGTLKDLAVEIDVPYTSLLNYVKKYIRNEQ